MTHWQQQGIDHISWLPPMAEAALTEASADEAPCEAPSADVLFLGNLTTPNNIRGVEWLVTEVMPRVLVLSPGNPLCIAGSNPGDHVRSLCLSHRAVLVPNPPDALAMYRDTRVLVNPVRTGSGTHVKAIEMLMTSAPIVSATQGTQGMPPHIKALFRVADDATMFADHIVAALNSNADERDLPVVRDTFGVVGLAAALAQYPLLSPCSALDPHR